MVSRRAVQSILGGIWFLDGLFQLKPQMFSPSFVQQVILPTAEGQPRWISTLVNWGAHVVTGHIVVWDTLFALVQLALGVAMMSNYCLKPAIIASVIWSSIVWVFGEGVGQIFTGQTLLLSGAPGAVFIYALIGISIWPTDDGNSRHWRAGGIRFAQISLAILMVAGFVMQLQPSFLTPTGLTRVIATPWLAAAIGKAGAIVSVVLGLIELALGSMLLFKYRTRLAASLSIILSILFWWFGQSFGQIFEPFATDFNSGLLMALLGVCARPHFAPWPVGRQMMRHRTP
ncbi:hypothetical protein Alches_20160 [Alicyclobacillus hesperidum subsp. aegles]|uniref:hypothetical protein n=1 Tax=Alicyclobacillus hesperidum TaxID=89784 RepID=UPI002229860D|nr:hypothetical protein [Alicyclobacillus hesperidum]GLG01975.1 hypothetical protein Alches_20160 [Alicyclobacillus hesperidum subsp. aegles]